MILYNNIACPFAHRAHFTLKTLGIQFTEITIPLTAHLTRQEKLGVNSNDRYQGVPLSTMQSIKDDFKKNINLNGEVPVIDDNGTIVKESDIVAEYLDLKYNGGLSIPSSDLKTLV